MTLHDLTEELSSTERDWARGGRVFREQFGTAAQNMRVGLYVLVCENVSDHPVFDRNGEGRLLIKPNALGVKYGKFQNGFLTRRFTDYKHLHRRLPDDSEEADVFTTLIRFALVLDLSDIPFAPANAAETFEPYWNALIESALQRREWLTAHQSRQSEWRHVQPPVAWQAVRDELRGVVPNLAKRIQDAAVVLAQPV